MPVPQPLARPAHVMSRGLSNNGGDLAYQCAGFPKWDKCKNWQSYLGKSWPGWICCTSTAHPAPLCTELLTIRQKPRNVRMLPSPHFVILIWNREPWRGGSSASAPRKKIRGGTPATTATSGCVLCKPKKGRGVSSDPEMYQADSEGGGTPPTHSANKAMMRDESGKKAMCIPSKHPNHQARQWVEYVRCVRLSLLSF